MEEAQRFFSEFSNATPAEWTQLPQSGSARRNFIARNPEGSFVITHNQNIQENESFFYFSNIFTKLNLNTPIIHKISNDRKWYIQSFLGKQTLSEIIANEQLSPRVELLVKETLRKLFELQQKTKGKIDYSQTFEYERYNQFPILHDLNYFKFLFVDILEIPYHKSSLLKEFDNLVEIIENIEPKTLIIRDFQARNIMIDDKNRAGFIDYQAAMEGPAIYDVVSFLYQAKANFPDDFRNKMIDFYINLFENEKDKKSLKTSIFPIRLIRNLQVLGAYGFRGLVQRKKHFIENIPQGIKNLQKTAEEWQEIYNFPELKSIINKLNINNLK